MNRRMMIELIRSHISNIKWLRNAASAMKWQKYQKKLIPAELVSKAEREPSLKRELVAQYGAKYPKKLERLRRELEEMAVKNPELKKLPNREEWETDLLFCAFAYGFLPSEYACYELHGKSEAERREFISDVDLLLLLYKINDFADITKFNDKFRTYQMFRPAYHRECISIQSEKDFASFSDFVRRHPVCVKKEAYECMGRSVELLRLSPDDPEEIRKVFHKMIKRGKHIIEEKIEQSPETAAFNPSSVNTVRCITVKNDSGVHVHFCVLRTGQDGSFVDNGGAGGIFSAIDENTGVLVSAGVDESGRRYKCHPVSGKEYVGFQLPHWPELVALCKGLAAQMDTVRYIGWDLAYTEEHGWVLVEGNARAQLLWQYAAVQGARKCLTGLMQDMELNF